jgi:molecular chaperone GrpE
MSNSTHPHEDTPELELPEPEPPTEAHTADAPPEDAPNAASEVLDPEPVAAETPPSDAESPHAADLIFLLQQNLELTKKLEETTRKMEEAQRGEAYAQADYQNYRKRSDERFAEQQKYNNAEFIKALLPAIDSFERALAAAEQSQNFEALIGGVKGTLKQLQSALQKAGVTPIEALGKEFDPKFHEAIGHAESDEYPSNTVAEEVQRGYVLHDRILRPSLVRVTD